MLATSTWNRLKEASSKLITSRLPINNKILQIETLIPVMDLVDRTSRKRIQIKISTQRQQLSINLISKHSKVGHRVLTEVCNRELISRLRIWTRVEFQQHQVSCTSPITTQWEQVIRVESGIIKTSKVKKEMIKESDSRKQWLKAARTTSITQ